MGDIILLKEPIAAERELSVVLYDLAGVGKTGVAGTVTVKVAKPGGNLAVDGAVTITETTGGVVGGSYRIRLSADAVSVAGQGQFEITQAGVIGPCYGYYTVKPLDFPYYGQAQAGAAAFVQLDAAASAVDSFYASATSPAVAVIVSGTGAGQSRVATGYTGASKQLAVSPNWVTAPDSTSVIKVLGLGGGSSSGADTAAIVAAIAAWQPDPTSTNVNFITFKHLMTVLMAYLAGNATGFPFTVQQQVTYLGLDGTTTRLAGTVAGGERNTTEVNGA